MRRRQGKIQGAGVGELSDRALRAHNFQKMKQLHSSRRLKRTETQITATTTPGEQVEQVHQRKSLGFRLDCTEKQNVTQVFFVRQMQNAPSSFEVDQLALVKEKTDFPDVDGLEDCFASDAEDLDELEGATTNEDVIETIVNTIPPQRANLCQISRRFVLAYGGSEDEAKAAMDSVKAAQGNADELERTLEEIYQKYRPPKTVEQDARDESFRATVEELQREAGDEVVCTSADQDIEIPETEPTRPARLTSRQPSVMLLKLRKGTGKVAKLSKLYGRQVSRRK